MHPTPMTRLQRITYRVWLAVGVVLLLAVSLYLAYRPLAIILAPLLFALLIVYLLNPVVDWFARYGLPRLLGTTLAYLLVIGVTFGLGMLVLPMLTSQFTEFAAEAPDLGANLAEGLRSLGARAGVDLEVDSIIDAQAMAQQLQQFVTEAENRETVLAVLGGLSGLARGAFFVLLTLFVTPVVAFYILVDLPRFQAATMRLIPPRHRDEVIEVGRKLTSVVGGFVRGQLVIAAFVGIASSIVFAVLGLRFWLVIGVIAGVTNFVPLLGPWVAGIIGVTVALVTEGFGLAVLVAVSMTAVQQVDSSLLSPLIMGRTVRVHPLAVLLAIIVAGAMYGVFGMLVVVPLLAGAKALAQHLWQTRVPWADEDAGAEVTAGSAEGDSLPGALEPSRPGPS
jgi:predicted PurR-regulated permease PerM